MRAFVFGAVLLSAPSEGFHQLHLLQPEMPEHLHFSERISERFAPAP
ncbi:hypothetical protein L6654_38785 [Bradyrhizobium sp. WYCCWR 13023]|uniref:Uncharacterized protein n=1 Tax=Bradyrhizobium zhengyangense TaxID=2911009 RepID=A0A9X1RH34_9BRAD|nr:hypothetical protein [Bradyrhizobium zhengyangense]MCG2632556.1 hypothetical protein [Bradyrhizobium zhengyangense]